MSKIYVLDHVREYYQDPENPEKKYMDFKGIGNFRSLKKAKKTVEKYKNLRGFKDYPKGFKITDYTLDSIYNSFIDELINLHSNENEEQISRVFCLYYILEDEDDYDETMLLGLFSSKAKANDAREKILTQTSLKHLSTNLQIFEEQVEKVNWEEGFITWKETR